jgi:hypothetical protein
MGKRGPCAFKETDVTRATKAAINAGIVVERVEVDKSGKITIIAAKPGQSNGEQAKLTPDDELAQWRRKKHNADRA